MSNSIVNKKRLSLFMSSEIHLTGGQGEGVNGTVDVCAMQAADWLAGGNGVSDAPECVCPVIRVYVIHVNDSILFEDFRDELKNFVPRLIGTRQGLDAVIKRAECVAKYATRFAKYAEHTYYTNIYAEQATEKFEQAAAYVDYAQYAIRYAEEATRYAMYAANTAAIKNLNSAVEIRALILECLNAMIEITTKIEQSSKFDVVRE